MLCSLFMNKTLRQPSPVYRFSITKSDRLIIAIATPLPVNGCIYCCCPEGLLCNSTRLLLRECKRLSVFPRLSGGFFCAKIHICKLHVLPVTSIQYRYAYNANSAIIDVSQLERSEVRGESFTCISCGNPLVAKLGEIKQKHFCHKQVQNCSPETYLHKLAKETFAKEYQACLKDGEPFYIELNLQRICNTYEETEGTCCPDRVDRIFDLTQRYKAVEIEARQGEFIPDILLKDESGEKTLFIEIAVTHKASEKKQASQEKIIEISIQDEEDISLFKKRLISCHDPKIKFINIHPKPVKEAVCIRDCGEDFLNKFSSCDKKFTLTSLESNGEINFRTIPIGYVDYLIGRLDKNTFSILMNPLMSYKIGVLANEAVKRGLIIRDCRLCRYHGESRWYQSDVFCKFKKRHCDGEDAVKCNFYRLEKKYLMPDKFYKLVDIPFIKTPPVNHQESHYLLQLVVRD